MKCYIFDIDGTLSNSDHRIHHIQKDPKDWAAFFAECHLDAPIPHIIELADDLADSAEIIFVSSRSDECRAQTDAWLRQQFARWVFDENDLPYLFMRKEGDHRDDDVVKLELYAEAVAAGWEPVMVFDDRARVVAAWRRAGIPCAQTAEGNF